MPILYLFAILAKPEDLNLILTLGDADHLGPERMRILGAYGHPGVVDTLLKAMNADDACLACAAGAAFTKITGADVDSNEQVTLPPEDGSEPDEFEAEFLDEATLPSPEKARDHWNCVKDEFLRGTRWARGVNVSGKLDKETLDQLDLESRWEASLRGRYEGTCHVTLAQLFMIPQNQKDGRAAGVKSDRVGSSNS
jgi:hypothetical protein